MARKNEAIAEEIEVYPLEPRYHPMHRIPRKIFDFLASTRLAMALLVALLVCCLTGVTVYRGEKAWELIFTTLWFNALLVLLVVNVACCFFGRIWGRRISVVSFGMILFHLSFVFVFLGIAYNSLFFFRGNMRLSEGETLVNADPKSYDVASYGRFFNFNRLKGETTLVRMHRAYMVSGQDKRAAYEVAVGQGSAKKTGMVYITHNLEYGGVTYFPDKEGYSLLAVLADKQGKEFYGAVLPLQSLANRDGARLYSTGTKEGPAGIAFPQGEVKPLYDLQIAYHPSRSQERGGEVSLEVRPLPAEGGARAERALAAERVPIGGLVAAGDHLVSVKEVRYWVGMKLSHEPGQPIILSSLWAGLAGMIITTIGRIARRKTGAGTDR